MMIRKFTGLEVISISDEGDNRHNLVLCSHVEIPFCELYEVHEVHPSDAIKVPIICKKCRRVFYPRLEVT